MTFWQMKEPLIPFSAAKLFHSLVQTVTLLVLLCSLGCMLVMAACFTYAHCAYNLLLSMLDCDRMHNAVT